MRFISKIKIVLWFILPGLIQSLPAQTIKENPYHLPIISTISAYDSVVSADSLKKLVDLEIYVPGIQPDIRYATSNNFTHKKIYTSAKAYARLSVARALAAVQADLKLQGLGLKVYDAYRPYAATLLFYETYRDTLFVAAPWKGSRHNRGCAVDVSLIDLKTGKELDMPTPFDDFTIKASSSFLTLPPKVLANRQILIDAMNSHKFTVYPTEWWHFDFSGWEGYELMDLSFEEMERTGIK